MSYVLVVNDEHHRVSGCPSDIFLPRLKGFYGRICLTVGLGSYVASKGEDRNLSSGSVICYNLIVKNEVTAVPIGVSLYGDGRAAVSTAYVIGLARIAVYVEEVLVSEIVYLFDCEEIVCHTVALRIILVVDITVILGVAVVLCKGKGILFAEEML